MKVNKPVLLIILCAAVGLGYVWFRGTLSRSTGETGDVAEKKQALAERKADHDPKARSAAGQAKKAGKGKLKKERISVSIVSSDEFAHLSGADRKLAEAIQAAQDAEDFNATLAAAQAAYKSANAELRQAAVEALGMLGDRALPELTPMMADPNEDVARAAMDAWELGLADVEKASDRVSIAKLALLAISDKDALTMIGGQFSAAATDFIDSAEDDEKALRRRVEVVQTVVDMIADEKCATRSNAAGEIYEEITGRAWCGIDEAEKYLRDPDNYEPPEDNASATTD